MKPVILPFHDRVRVTSPYGERFLNGGYDWHNGIDLVGVDDITAVKETLPVWRCNSDSIVKR